MEIRNNRDEVDEVLREQTISRLLLSMRLKVLGYVPDATELEV